MVKGKTMATYVNIKGPNASRKSTKLDCLMKYLLSKGATEEAVEGGYLLTLNDVKYYFFGKKRKNGMFTGLDSTPLAPRNSMRERHEHFGKMIKEYGVDYVFTEGFFNNHGSEQEKMEFLKPLGITRRHFYFQTFDTLEEQLEAQRKRKVTNTDKKATINTFNKLNDRIEQFQNYNEPNTITEKVSALVENDFYVKKYFNDSYPEYEIPKSIEEIKEAEKSKINEDEW